MVNTTRRQIVVTKEADKAMEKLAKRLTDGNVSQLYREAVSAFLRSHGIEVSVVVDIGSPLLLAARNGDRRTDAG